MKQFFVFALALLLSSSALAQSRVTADQGQPGKTGAWPVKVTDGTDTANVTTNGAVSTFTSADKQPGTPEVVSVSTTAARTTAATLAAGDCVRVVCDVDTYYLVGASSVSATTSSNWLPARTVERFCLTTGSTHLAFITATGTGSCQVSELAAVAP